MQNHKLHHFNSYDFLFKLLLLVISCFLFGCTEQKEVKQVLLIQNQVQVTENAVNINTASIIELEKLPNVGPQTAKNIIEYREKFGRFRKPEHLLFVRRISDKDFRAIRNLIKVE